MPFGIVGWTGPEMRQLVGFGDRSTGRVLLGTNLGRGIVTNGDFTAYVSDSAATRSSSQITLGRLVIIMTIMRVCLCMQLAVNTVTRHSGVVTMYAVVNNVSEAKWPITAVSPVRLTWAPSQPQLSQLPLPRPPLQPPSQPPEVRQLLDYHS